MTAYHDPIDTETGTDTTPDEDHTPQWSTMDAPTGEREYWWFTSTAATGSNSPNTTATLPRIWWPRVLSDTKTQLGAVVEELLTTEVLDA